MVARFEQFRIFTDSEETETWKCLQFIIGYQKDLSPHVLAEDYLCNRLQIIFRHISSCAILFRRTEAHENAQNFCQKMISAPANYNLGFTSQSSSSAPCLTSQTECSPPIPTDARWSGPLAFFFETPSLPCHRRPLRFQDRLFCFRHRPFSRPPK